MNFNNECFMSPLLMSFNLSLFINVTLNICVFNNLLYHAQIELSKIFKMCLYSVAELFLESTKYLISYNAYSISL